MFSSYKRMRVHTPFVIADETEIPKNAALITPTVNAVIPVNRAFPKGVKSYFGLD